MEKPEEQKIKSNYKYKEIPFKISISIRPY